MACPARVHGSDILGGRFSCVTALKTGHVRLLECMIVLVKSDTFCNFDI